MSYIFLRRLVHVVMQITHCEGHVSAKNRLHHLHWSINGRWGTAIMQEGQLVRCMAHLH